MIKSFFKFTVTLTWSKIIALLILIDATYLDVTLDKGGTLFMYAVPFVVGLVVGKQSLDAIKETKTKQ